MELQNKVCFIAGSSGAIGRAIAPRFYEEGALLALTYLSRSAGQPEAWLPDDPRVLPLALDVSSQAATLARVNQVAERFGRIDCLVNCTGVLGPVGATGQIDPAAWAEAVQINLLGSFYLTHAVLPFMQAQGKGKIIHFSGGGAAYARPYYTAYSASKAALVRFCESLAVELRESRIDVNTIAPGAVNSRMWDQVRALKNPDPRTSEELKRMESTGGVSPQRAADLALFLASDRSDGLSGRLISAVWDEWDTLSGRIRQVMDTEAGTLRRVPFTDS